MVSDKTKIITLTVPLIIFLIILVINPVSAAYPGEHLNQDLSKDFIHVVNCIIINNLSDINCSVIQNSANISINIPSDYAPSTFIVNVSGYSYENVPATVYYSSGGGHYITKIPIQSNTTTTPNTNGGTITPGGATPIEITTPEEIKYNLYQQIWNWITKLLRSLWI